MPLIAEEESMRLVIASSHNGSRYKAVEALFDIGGPALPSILSVIRDRFKAPLGLRDVFPMYQQIGIKRVLELDWRAKAATGGDICFSLHAADDKALISFLEENSAKRDHENADCMAFAISELGKAKDNTAIKALSNYLDFE
jgi:hypothetical protein